MGLLAGSEGSKGTAGSEVKLEEEGGKEASAGSRSGLRGVAAGSDAGGGMGEAEDMEEVGRNGLVA